MATLLHVDSSPRPASSTRRLTADFAAAWCALNPDGVVLRHDLPAMKLGHLEYEQIEAFEIPPDLLTEEHFEVLAMSTAIVADARAADTWVIGAPMWNFGIPSYLKAWVDHVVRIGHTVEFGPTGPVGLLAGKRVVVATSRGGDYRPGLPTMALDHQTPYLLSLFNLLAIEDVSFVHADRQGPAFPDGEAFLEEARTEIRRLAPSGASAAL